MGTIITGFTSVDANDYYFEGLMRLCDDALISQYGRLTDIIHAQEAAAIAQLALAHISVRWMAVIFSRSSRMTSEPQGKVWVSS